MQKINVALDISSTQSGSKYRGIGFYTQRLVEELEKLYIKNTEKIDLFFLAMEKILNKYPHLCWKKIRLIIHNDANKETPYTLLFLSREIAIHIYAGELEGQRPRHFYHTIWHETFHHLKKLKKHSKKLVKYRMKEMDELESKPPIEALKNMLEDICVERTIQAVGDRDVNKGRISYYLKIMKSTEKHFGEMQDLIDSHPEVLLKTLGRQKIFIQHADIFLPHMLISCMIGPEYMPEMSAEKKTVFVKDLNRNVEIMWPTFYAIPNLKEAIEKELKTIFKSEHSIKKHTFRIEKKINSVLSGWAYFVHIDPLVADAMYYYYTKFLEATKSITKTLEEIEPGVEEEEYFFSPPEITKELCDVFIEQVKKLGTG